MIDTGDGEQEDDGAKMKLDYMAQIKQAREKAAAEEFKFAEDDVIKKFEEEKKQKQEDARQKRLVKLKKAQEKNTMMINLCGADVKV